MRYLFCIILPPLAILSVGRPIAAILNLPLCLFFWFPGVIHAFAVVNRYYDDQRMRGFGVNVNVVNQNTVAPNIYNER